jgi:hypothetical protein
MPNPLIHLRDKMSDIYQHRLRGNWWIEGARTVVVTLIILFIAWLGTQGFSLLSSDRQAIRIALDEVKLVQQEIKIHQRSIDTIQAAINEQQSMQKTVWDLSLRVGQIEKVGTHPQQWFYEQTKQALQTIEKLSERLQRAEQVIYQFRMNRLEAPGIPPAVPQSRE